MNFIHANMLYFAAAGIIPIIIHLIFRKRYKKVKWAAMKFLLAAYKKNKRSLLVENLLLLIMRIAVLILLAFMFSRPTANESFLTRGTTRLTDHYIFLLDNSFSMSVQDGNSSPFNKGKEHIRQVIKKTQTGDSVTFVTLNQNPRIIDAFHEVSPAEKGTIIQQMESIKASEMATDVIASINLISDLVGNSEYAKYKNKKVIILTDLQRKPWVDACKNHNFLTMLEKIGDTTQLIMIDVGVRSDPVNLTIEAIETDGIVATGGLTRFIATIGNYSNKNAEGIAVKFSVRNANDTYNEKLGIQGTEYVSIAAGEQQKITFFYNFAMTGSHSVTVSLVGDHLEADNKRHLIVKVVKHINVLIIDGDSNEKTFESETDYLLSAIGKSRNNIIQTKVVDISTFLPSIKFSNYNVIILANLQTFDDERRFDELREFVSKGGGLFIWLGDKVSYEYYNEEFYRDGLGVLPAELVGRPIGKASDKEEKTIFKLDKIQKNHPSLKYFSANNDLLQDFRNYLTYKFFPVKIDDGENAQKDSNVSVIAHYDHPQKYPAIIEKVIDRGKVILCTSTIDKAWNNLHSDQFGYVFLILIHEFLQYLVSPPIDENNLSVGVAIVKKFPYYIGQEAELTAPKETPIQKGIYADKGIHKVEHKDTYKSGIYRLDLKIPEEIVKEQEIEETVGLFAINVKAEEGNILRATQQEILGLLEGVKISFREKNRKTNSIIDPLSDAEYWKIILLIVLLFLLAETFLAMWFGRYNK